MMACQQFPAFPAVGYTCTLMNQLYHNLSSDDTVSHEHPIIVEQVVVIIMVYLTISINTAFERLSLLIFAFKCL